jgi:hypothetical protein
MAMGMVEYFVAHPEKLDRLYDWLLRLLCRKAAAEPTVEEKPPKSQDQLDAEAYLRSIGMLPPEETP